MEGAIRTLTIAAVSILIPLSIFVAVRTGHHHITFISRSSAASAHPSFYVADIPDKYTNGVYGKEKEEKDTHHGYAALGTFLSTEHDHWDTIWHRVVAWYIDQLSTSFLRTCDIDTADIIFVPATIHEGNKKLQQEFIVEANTFLPYFGQKPHLVVLSHAPSWYDNMLKHNNSASFTFISWGKLDRSVQNVIGSPAFSHVHWSRGSLHMRRDKMAFGRNQIITSKKVLVVRSFVVRNYPDRAAVHQYCLEKPNLCNFVEYNGPQDAVPVYEAYKSAWYVLHPRGDFLSRNSWFDTWLACTIPVVFQSEYIDSVPFGDVIDYAKIMTYVPEEKILGNDGQNIVGILEEMFDTGKAVQQISYIYSIRHVFQYMLNPVHELIRWDQRERMHSDDDAFTFTMKSVLRNVCSRGWCSRQCALA